MTPKPKPNPFRKMNNRKVAQAIAVHGRLHRLAEEEMTRRAKDAGRDSYALFIDSLLEPMSDAEIQAARDRGMCNEWKRLPKSLRRRKMPTHATPPTGICRVCGCTQTRACNPPCSWVDMSRTKCSACFDETGRQL